MLSAKLQAKIESRPTDTLIRSDMEEINEDHISFYEIN